MLKGVLPDRTWRILLAPLLAIVLAVQLGGCASSTNAPVVDRQHRGQPARTVKSVTSGSYVVRPQDTLYSIAFRYGRDWKELAVSNRIGPPYTIRPGQVIYFSKKPQTTAAKPKPAAQARPVATARPQPAAKPKPATPAAKPASKPKPVAAPTGNWLWPAEGTVISRFSSATTLNKGIDIAGKIGQPVKATAKGTVVYAGSDLRGYGELLIIKHNDTFISAYGHNRRLLVSEGQEVRAGQQIAEMGSTGTDRVKLHFEIRRQGSPVDPLQYLPKR